MIKFFTNNLGWKLLSLLLAVLLWVAFVREPQLATTVSAPVLFQGVPENLEFSGDLVTRVQLEVRGPSSRLRPEDLSDAAVILDLGNVDRPGDRTYRIEASNVSLPSTVMFLRAVPAQIRLRFERRVSRRVPVRVHISNPPPDGYQIERQEVVPDQLPIVGPQSNVEQIGFVDTDSIDLSSVVGAAELQVSAFVSDPQVRFDAPPKVTVKVFVQKIQ